MLNRPLDNIQNHDFIENLHSSNPDEANQYGIHPNQHDHVQHDRSRGDGHAKDTLCRVQERQRSILLDVPPETLTSITSYLTPPALLSLGCVSSYLAHHVQEDNTWRRAFVCHFLGISPEADINIGNSREDGIDRMAMGSSWKTLLLRRVEGTWRDEFAWRYVMINRWNRSKSTTVTHTPIIRSNISSLHLMNIPSPAFTTAQTAHAPNASSSAASPAPLPYIYPSTRFAAPALLSTSNQYGIVARSLPLTGKVLTGYLDASTGARLGVPAIGAGNLNFGMGNLNGNPNVQFTPNVTASDVTSSIPLPTQGEIASGHPALGTAHIAWGTSAGDLIFTTAPRAMNVNVNDGSRGGGRNGGRSGVEVTRCRFGDEHEGAVRDVKWVNGGSLEQSQAGKWAVSGGSDGRVKLWDARSAVCLWTSGVMHDRERLGTVSDPCVRVCSFFPSLLSDLPTKPDTPSGVILAVGESGDIYAWVGLDSPTGDAFDSSKVKNITIDCPFKPSTFYLHSVSPAPGRHAQFATKVSALAIDPNTTFPEGDGEASGTRLSFLVAYENDPLFYRVTLLSGDIGKPDDQVDITPFGNPHFGPTSVVKPFFGRRGGGTEPSFVLVGDHIGCVSLYDWDAPPYHHQAGVQHAQQNPPQQNDNHKSPIPPIHTFEAHRDGASVTALWWDGLVLVTGSARGTTHVWDGITFGHLRSFVSPVKRIRGGGGGQPQHGNDGEDGQRVRHIVMNEEKDILVVGVGDTVMAWHAGVLGKGARTGRGGGGKGGVRGRHTPGTGLSPGKKRGAGGGGRFVGEYEMRQTILESRDLLAFEGPSSSTRDNAQAKKMQARREREHRDRLDALGLSEVEAVEYALMLSRDEADERARARVSLEEEDEGVFEGDFDDEEVEGEGGDGSVYGGVSYSVSSSSSSDGSLGSSAEVSSTSGISSTRHSSLMSSSSSSRGSHSHLHSHSHTRPLGHRALQVRAASVRNNSNEKLQVIPSSASYSTHRQDEPMEAGETYLDGDADVDDRQGPSGGGDVDEFPPIAVQGSRGASPDHDHDRHRAGDGDGETEKEKGKGKEKPGKEGFEDGKKDKKKKKQKNTSKVSSATVMAITSSGGANVSAPSASAQSLVVNPNTTTTTTTSATPTTPSGSPTSSMKKNAWSVPLKTAASAGMSRPSSSSSVSPLAGARGGSFFSMGAGGVRGGVTQEEEEEEEEDMDEDLRFALELSLVEARSRGEDV